MTTGDDAVDHGVDLIIVIDWSASARPTRGRDSVWSAMVSMRQDGSRPKADGVPVNHPTRAAAMDWLAAVIDDHPGWRILVGVDASLGAPAGVAEAVGGCPNWMCWWQTLADLVDDRADNSNNRWEVAAELNRRIGRHHRADDHARRVGAENAVTTPVTTPVSTPVTGSVSAGPFWGGPAAAEAAGIGRTRPVEFAVGEYRRCEIELRRLGRRPFPLWQLAYAGSVGSQALLAVAALGRLRRRFVDRVRVWPFEPTADSALVASDREGPVIIAEVWPSMWPLDLGSHPIRDAAQVGELARLLADAPLAEWLDESVLPEIARTEEGWVLGLPAPVVPA